VKFLLVENRPENLDLIQRALREGMNGAPFAVDHEISFSEALQKMKRGRYDVCLIDDRPGEDESLDFLRALRAQGHVCPVIFFSRQSDQARTVQAMKAGATDYLAPGALTPEALARAVRDSLYTFKKEEERRRIDERLRESEERLRTVLEAVREGITFSDESGRFEIFNSEMARLTGYTMEDANACGDFNTLLYPHPEDRQRALEGLRRVIETGDGWETEAIIQTKTGALRNCLVSTCVVPYKGKRMFLSAYHDITERKRAERELRLAEERYHTIFDKSAVAITVTDAQERIVSWNKFAENMLGMTREDLYLRPISSLYPEGEWRKIRSYNIRQKGMQHHLETKMITRSGALLDIDVSISVLKNPHGEITGSIGIIRDISERKKAENELHASHEVTKNKEKFIEAVIHAPAVAAFVIDINHKVLYWNKACEELTGFPEKALIGTDRHWMPFYREQKPCMADLILDSREHEMPRYYPQCSKSKLSSGAFEAEGWYPNLGGKDRYMLFEAAPILDQDGRKIAAIETLTDITERKQAEENLRKANEALGEKERKLRSALEALRTLHVELNATQSQLIQAEKFKSVGRLAAGIAHEVKNPLAIMLQGVDYLATKFPPGDEDIRLLLQDMTEAVCRADAVIRGLLDFAAPSPLEILPHDLNAVVDMALLLMRHQFNRCHIEATKEFAEGIPPVPLDKNRIEQVLLNLVSNAVFAMPEGGKLKVTTEAIRDDGGATMAVIHIDDTGPGIPPEIADKIFDPFFTTRRGSGGTGLGLPIVKNIIEMHEGKITIASRKEGGVRVSIFFRIH
jgi:PAS domain S-box-containing protein